MIKDCFLRLKNIDSFPLCCLLYQLLILSSILEKLKFSLHRKRTTNTSQVQARVQRLKNKIRVVGQWLMKVRSKIYCTFSQVYPQKNLCFSIKIQNWCVQMKLRAHKMQVQSTRLPTIYMKKSQSFSKECARIRHLQGRY